MTLCAIALWAVCSAAGLGYMIRYSSKPGAQRASPATWPEASAIPREPGAATLVVFLHPRCPCSSATVSELERAVARPDISVRLVAVLCRPVGVDAEWSRTPLRARVERLALGRVIDDDGGREAALFGAATSGETTLYDARGRLVFRGGLTPSRGHEGDNPGRAAVANWLAGGASPPSTSPVYGCSLVAPSTSACADGACCEVSP